MKKKLVILTGAGMSSESGIRTFRDSGGLWEEYDVTEVATHEAWKRNRDLVLRFYNERRRQLESCKPNGGHIGLAQLEKYFDVQIITQNIDDLHERAGSTKILHLHGELTKARSTADSRSFMILAIRISIMGINVKREVSSGLISSGSEKKCQ